MEYSWKLIFLIIACFAIVLLLSYAFNPKVFLSPRGGDDAEIYNFCGACNIREWRCINVDNPQNGSHQCALGKTCVDQGWCYDGWHNAGRRCKCQAPGEGIAGIKFADE